MTPEDLVTLAQREHRRGFADLEYRADQTLTRYLRWSEQDKLDVGEIQEQLQQAPKVGAVAVRLFEQLTAVGTTADDAAETAVQAAAAAAMREQAGAPEQAASIHRAFGALTEQVAGGGDQANALADFREAIAGWRGDGYAEGPLAAPIMVAFDDGTVIPDGVELAGIRETGARHRIVTPQVQAGIDAYLAARAEGVEHLAALELAGDGPGVYGTVAQFADDVERSEVDLTAARDAAVASTVADAAIGQFLSLRNSGIDVDHAAATAAGGDPVAIHAIAGFVGRVRDGAAEDVAEVDAWAGAVAAVRHGEDYRGSIPEGVELPGFETAHDRARTALEFHTTGTAPAGGDELAAETVRRYASLTRLGMNPVTAARLAAADTAAHQAKVQAHHEFRVLHEAESVIGNLSDELDPADADVEDNNTTTTSGDVAEPDPVSPLADAVAESGEAVEAAAAALQETEHTAQHETDDDTTRAERCARWNNEDQAEQTAATADNDTERWQQ